MATTESNITGLRRKLGRLRSKLSQTREALNNIIPADADESLIITLELQENEFKLAINHAIEELAQAAKAEDGLFRAEVMALTEMIFENRPERVFDRLGSPGVEQSVPLLMLARPALDFCSRQIALEYSQGNGAATAHGGLAGAGHWEHKSTSIHRYCEAEVGKFIYPPHNKTWEGFQSMTPEGLHNLTPRYRIRPRESLIDASLLC